MTYLVTGAAGFIGSHLCEALLSKGHRVRGVDCFTRYYPRRLKLSNISSATRNASFSLNRVDLANADIRPLLRDAEYVFHLAAQPGVRASWGRSFSRYVQDNIMGTQRLLEASKDSGLKKFIYASSSSIYGDSERLPTPEDAPPRPNSPYGATKLTGEHLCRIYERNYGVPVVVLRYFTVYGPRQRPDMAFNKFIRNIFRGETVEIYGDGKQLRDYTYVDDTVSATVLSRKAKVGSVYNVATGRTRSINDVLDIMEPIIGKRARRKYSPSQRGDVRNTSADISKIKRELGYAPKVGLEAGIERQVLWQRGKA